VHRDSGDRERFESGPDTHQPGLVQNDVSTRKRVVRRFARIYNSELAGRKIVKPFDEVGSSDRSSPL
jgi:hypothetical protein